jgi:hypothetical protein
MGVGDDDAWFAVIELVRQRLHAQKDVQRHVDRADSLDRKHELAYLYPRRADVDDAIAPFHSARVQPGCWRQDSAIVPESKALKPVSSTSRIVTALSVWR